MTGAPPQDSDRGLREALLIDQNLKVEKLPKCSPPANGLHPASTDSMTTCGSPAHSSSQGIQHPPGETLSAPSSSVSLRHWPEPSGDPQGDAQPHFHGKSFERTQENQHIHPAFPSFPTCSPCSTQDRVSHPCGVLGTRQDSLSLGFQARDSRYKVRTADAVLTAAEQWG